MPPVIPSETSLRSPSPKTHPETASVDPSPVHHAVLICIQWRDWHNRRLFDQFTETLHALIPQQGGVMLSATGAWFLAAFNIPDAVPFPAYLAVQTGLELLRILYDMQTGEQSLILPGISIEEGEVALSQGHPSPVFQGHLIEISQSMAQHAEEGVIVISHAIYHHIHTASLPMKIIERSEISPDDGLPALKVLKLALPTVSDGVASTGTLSEMVQAGDSRTQIIVAEDNPALRGVFAKVLKNAGFRVKSAASGYEVVQYLNHGLPDVILMDVGLPGYSGLDLIRKIRDQQGDRHVFIIVVTGNHLAEQTPEAEHADLFLLKPVSTRDLLDLVQRFMARVASIR